MLAKAPDTVAVLLRSQRDHAVEQPVVFVAGLGHLLPTELDGGPLHGAKVVESVARLHEVRAPVGADGTVTNVVTSAKVSPEADCPLLPELLVATAQRFAVKEVSADKAYLSKKNLEAIDKVGAVDSLVKVTNARGRDVTARLAYSVARLTDVGIDDLLAGALLSPRTCPHCGRPPSDFTDEETVVEDQPREAVLKLVK